MRTTSTPAGRASTQDLAAARLIRRATTSFAARARAARAGRLTLNQTAVLGILARSNGITPGEVADQLQVQPQSLTRTFAHLERSGWLTRTPDPADGRQSLLTITASGRAVLHVEMKPRDEWVADRISTRLTPAERDILVVAAHILERMADVEVGPVEG